MHHGFACSFAAASVLLISLAPVAEAAATMADVDEITNQIVIKELDLYKLNTRVKLHSLPKSMWGSRRNAVYGVTNNTLTSIGAFKTGWGRFHWLHQIRKAPADFFEHAAWCRVIANAITVGGTTCELAADAVGAWKDRRQGVDLSTMSRYAENLKEEIDDLLSKRATMTAEVDCTPGQKKILQDEGLVLADTHQLAANEFSRFYAEAKSSRVARNVGYLVSWISNFESGAGSFYAGIHASQLRHVSSATRARMGGVGGITDIISGSLNVAGPFIVRGTQLAVQKIAYTAAAKRLDCQQSAQLAQLEEHQRSLLEDSKSEPQLSVKGVLLRRKACATEAHLLAQHETLRRAEQRSSHARFIESAINNGISGGTKIANGVGGAIGGFKYTADARERFLWSGGVSIAYGTGNAFSAAETLRNQFWNEIKAHDARSKHRTTAETLAAQLEELEQTQSAIREEAKGAKFAATPAAQPL